MAHKDSRQDVIEARDGLNRWLEMEDEDAKRDQQRKMVWFALFGMLGYPLFVFASGALGFDNESKIIGDMSGVYFMSVGLVVSAFFGADAYVKGKEKKGKKDGDE